MRLKLIDERPVKGMIFLPHASPLLAHLARGSSMLSIHYERIAKWKYGESTAVESAATARRPVAV
jgi:hypothetical protein